MFTQDDSPTPEIESHSLPEMSPIEVHKEGVLHLLLSLKVFKATDPDKVPSRLLKELAHQIAPVLRLTLLYNASINQGSVPSDWKKANIIPIFKKGSRSCPSNYRPVSLKSMCCKTLEYIMYSNIVHHLEEYNIICDEQHGFHSGHSCKTRLLITVHDLANNLNNDSKKFSILKMGIGIEGEKITETS